MHKKIFGIFIIIFFLLEVLIANTGFGIQNNASEVDEDSKHDFPNPIESENILSNISFIFTENYGQLKNDEIYFYVQGGGIWFTNNEVWFEVRDETPIISPELRVQSLESKYPLLEWQSLNLPFQ